MSFASSFLALASSEMKTTRSARFLTEMLEIIPWEEYLTILKPYTKPAKTGRPRKDTRILLKMYFLQQWYGLSDEATEDAVYDRLSFQKFLDINLSTDTVPDSTTLEDFRHLLETHKLSQIFFEAIQSFMQRHNLVMKKGTSVDATIIEAPSSTKNQSKKRDPEMRSTKKGNDWYFGMKVHTGTDIDSKTAHTIHVTSANIHDSEKFEECLHGEEKAVFADKAYHKKQRKQNMRQKGIYCGIIDKASR
jgi:IS5 family transposase